MTMELAELVESFREELRAVASPWRTREAAAEYLGCTANFIDVMVAKGELERHYLHGSPRFKVSDLDAQIGKTKRALRPIQKSA